MNPKPDTETTESTLTPVPRVVISAVLVALVIVVFMIPAALPAGVLFVGCAAWGATLIVTFAIPADHERRQPSVLEERAVWLAGRLVGAALLGFTAFLGAAIGRDLEEQPSWDAVGADVLLPLQLGVAFLPWAFGMLLAYDLWRVGAGTRATAVADLDRSIRHAIASVAGAARADHVAVRRARAAVRWWLSVSVRPVAAFVLAWLVPAVLTALVADRLGFAW